MRSATGRIYVAELSLKELAEKYQVRRVLEGLAARLAAEHMEDKQLETLRQLLGQMREAVQAEDSPTVTRLGTEFHAAIIEVCGNDYLKATLHDLSVSIRRYRSAAVDIPGRVHDSLQEHERIFNALVSRDGDGAALHMEQHIAGSERQLQRIVKTTIETESAD